MWKTRSFYCCVYCVVRVYLRLLSAVSVDFNWLKSYQLRFFRRLKWQRHVKSSHSHTKSHIHNLLLVNRFFVFRLSSVRNCEISFVAITLKGRHCVSCHCLRDIFISFCLHRIKFCIFQLRKKTKTIFDGISCRWKWVPISVETCAHGKWKLLFIIAQKMWM